MEPCISKRDANIEIFSMTSILFFKGVRGFQCTLGLSIVLLVVLYTKEILTTTTATVIGSVKGD